MNYIVTRHPGAQAWLTERVEEPAIALNHLDNMHGLNSGDTVTGTLPIHLIAALCAKNVRYLHLEIDLPEVLRGHELSSGQLTALGAKLVEYVVMRPTADNLTQRMVKDRGDEK